VDLELPRHVRRLVNVATIEDDGTQGADDNPDDNLARDETPIDGVGPVHDIPTASQWGLLLLTVLTATAGWRYVRLEATE
jgi:hypothetical protein